MPTATDKEGHAITYSCTSTEPSVSYNTATKVITFAATTPKVMTPITISLNAKDEEPNASGTSATLTVYNGPPTYKTAPPVTAEFDHSDVLS
jgi:hypothetical protein